MAEKSRQGTGFCEFSRASCGWVTGFSRLCPPASSTSAPAMAKPRLNLRSKKDAPLKSFAEAIIRAMRDSEYFADQQDKIDAVDAVVQDYAESLTEQASAESFLRAATVRKQQARKATEEGLTGLASLVALVAKGRATVISSAAMELKHERKRLGKLPAPENLSSETSEWEGACELRWELVHGSSIYEIEYRLHPVDSPWQHFGYSTAAKCRVTGLVPGTMYFFRVRAIGSAGASPWSGQTQKRAA